MRLLSFLLVLALVIDIGVAARQWVIVTNDEID
jgi:hypothetical protein